MEENSIPSWYPLRRLLLVAGCTDQAMTTVQNLTEKQTKVPQMMQNIHTVKKESFREKFKHWLLSRLCTSWSVTMWIGSEVLHCWFWKVKGKSGAIQPTELLWRTIVLRVYGRARRSVRLFLNQDCVIFAKQQRQQTLQPHVVITGCRCIRFCWALSPSGQGHRKLFAPRG